jgi:O-antigen/teichoic acid export membrane protein
VVRFIELGLYLLPLGVFTGLLYGTAVGESRWNVVTLSKLLNSGGPTLAIVALSLTGAITVASVAITYIACGIVASAPFLITLRGSRPWRVDPAVARAGLAFGTRSWLATLATVGNVQLDQVLMTGMVSSRQLGLYSLAVTLSTAASSLVVAAGTALSPRVAVGDAALAARACRVTVFAVVAFGALMAATSPWTVPFVFGGPFRAAIPMLLILLVAGAFLAPVQLLGSALTALDNPAADARGQLAGLAVTVPALIVLVPALGGVGAAWASLLAYVVSFAVIVVAASRTLRLPARALLLVAPSDARWVAQKLGGRLRRSGGVLPTSAQASGSERPR